MGHANSALGTVVNARKHIDPYWLAELIAIKLEHIRRPTPKQEHDALNDAIRDLKTQWGEVDIPQWPRTSNG